MSFVKSIFGSASDRTIKHMMPVVDKIEGMRNGLMVLSDNDLSRKTDDFKKRLADGESLDSILPEAFAVVREASRRVLGLEHYRVQLIGGIVLYYGCIAEMRTGEGKTLVAALPAYLKALTGKGVHVVTVNDYLAKRDADEIGQIHRFLGLSVGCVLSGMNTLERKDAYACDITYVTNNELGFDYLRDNMAVRLANCVQRDLHYAIIDEVDSILIDEARTPLIISGASNQSVSLYESCNHLVRMLKRGESSGELSKIDLLSGVEVKESGDYIVNEKDKFVHLTEQGVKKVEKFFHIQNLADPDNLEIQHHMTMALKAHNLMHRDKDYVVTDNVVLIVDEFTGRIMKGRRYSDGLHQAIEAKEGVEIQRENRTMATITLQNFFNKYEMKAGMTGTAMTEAQEFKDIYHMKVVSIPTNKPVIREDLDDLVYLTKSAKYRAIVKEVKRLHERKQPVLVGTVTIDVSEILSNMLSKEGIPHQVLNAKFHEKEAEIIAHAGEAGMVTIATNMAGRGTDIKLDDESRRNGGLYIIGTERHESRRIDNQLRGRSGRQGDPGTSQFYISLEDDVLRLFGSESMLNLFRNMGVGEDEVIVHRRLTKTILHAQEKIEANNFSIRKNLTDFDAVNNEHRELIYADRRRALEGDDMSESIQNMMQSLIQQIVYQTFDDKSGNCDVKRLNGYWQDIFGRPLSLNGNKVSDKDVFVDNLIDAAEVIFSEKETEFTPAIMREVERMALLRCIDMNWMQHMDDLDQLRQGVGLVSYGQKDPVVEYRMQAFQMFDEMLLKIRHDTIRMIFKARVAQKPQIETEESVTEEN